jgi:hypothetical protein
MLLFPVTMQQERFGSRRSTPARADHHGGRAAALRSFALENRPAMSKGNIGGDARCPLPEIFDLLTLVEQYHRAPCGLEAVRLVLQDNTMVPQTRTTQWL